MLSLAADENLKRPIVTGLRRRLPGVDVKTVQQAGLAGASDPEVLAWAAAEGRVVVTHDTRTLAAHAFERVAAGEPMAGVIEVPDLMAIGQAIEELVILIELLEREEIAARVLRLPL